MTAREFVELQAYDQAFPITQWREDFRTAQIASAIWAAAGAKNLKIADFLPKWGFDLPEKAEPPSAVDSFKAFLLSMASKA